MELNEFLKRLNAGEYIASGSDLHLFMHEASQEALRITSKINGGYLDPTEIRALMSELTGKPIDQSFTLFPPFYSDFGKNIHIGKDVFINSGCRFQDQGGITIGDGALIGHCVVVATLNHSIAASRRHDIRPAPVSIGKNVWIGAHATILPGVSIGDDSVIAAGAVVAKDVPINSIAGGVPSRIIREITEK
jgi:acetyltransferase-like isoleucine patch superfamily enzyme